MAPGLQHDLVAVSQAVVARTLGTLKQAVEQVQSWEWIAPDTAVLLNRIAQLEQALGLMDATPPQLKLPKVPNMLLQLLMARQIVSWEAAYAVIYPSRRPHLTKNILQTHLYRLRKALRPYGITVETDWANGCYMSLQMKTRVKNLMVGIKTKVA